MIVGAATAIAFLYFLEPRVTVDETTIRAYDAIKLIAAALLVGSGGSSVLKSLRERLLRAQLEAINSATNKIAKDALEKRRGLTAEEGLKAISSVLAEPGPK